jgi:bacterioferritin-associated ferredoxin
MYVCVCKAVTHAEVDRAIEGGALSVAEVTQACRAGGDCGACHAMIDQMIEGSDCAAAQPPMHRLALLRSHAA